MGKTATLGSLASVQFQFIHLFNKYLLSPAMGQVYPPWTMGQVHPRSYGYKIEKNRISALGRFHPGFTGGGTIAQAHMCMHRPHHLISTRSICLASVSSSVCWENTTLHLIALVQIHAQNSPDT